MPLSDREQKLLSQLEEQLLAEDPRFASTMRGNHRPRGGKRLIIGVIGVALGLVLIVLAVAQKVPVLAVPAFLLMLAGAWYALSRPAASADQTTTPSAAPRGTPRAKQQRGQGNFLNRIEQRFERRRDEGQGRQGR